MWTIGIADRLRFPPLPERARESREMLAFAHIPTGATANTGFDIDEAKARSAEPTSAMTAIGTDVETGGATP